MKESTRSPLEGAARFLRMRPGSEGGVSLRGRAELSRRSRLGLVKRACVALSLAIVFSASAPAAAQEKGIAGKPDPEDKKLGERLIRRAVKETDEELMPAIIRLMNEAARKLEIEFNAAEETQILQRQIMDQLEEAIKIAASQRRPRMPASESYRADKRRKPGHKRRDPKPGADIQDKARDSADANSTTAPGSSVRGDPHVGALRDTRRTWGHLPMREREEVIQGISESFLERYREWIERYYRALQETED